MMGVFDKVFGKKKEEARFGMRSVTCAPRTMYAPVKGRVIPLSEVEDPAFAGGMLGQGVGVEPEEDNLYAPADGELTVVFPTGHAVGMKTADGMEILLHIGIDTVNLQGKHFTTHVKDGDTVKAGQPLITFELEQVKKAGYDTVIPLVFTDPDHQIDMDSLRMRYVKHGDIV